MSRGFRQAVVSPPLTRGRSVLTHSQHRPPITAPSTSPAPGFVLRLRNRHWTLTDLAGRLRLTCFLSASNWNERITLCQWETPVTIAQNNFEIHPANLVLKINIARFCGINLFPALMVWITPGVIRTASTTTYQTGT